MVAGLLTMLIGILGAIAQSDIKRLLSFTLVSHIGYMVFGSRCPAGSACRARSTTWRTTSSCRPPCSWWSV
jgi:NADH:ubiquinone oxidoreductase subunit 2 (subunit N)